MLLYEQATSHHWKSLEDFSQFRSATARIIKCGNPIQNLCSILCSWNWLVFLPDMCMAAHPLAFCCDYDLRSTEHNKLVVQLLPVSILCWPLCSWPVFPCVYIYIYIYIYIYNNKVHCFNSPMHAVYKEKIHYHQKVKHIDRYRLTWHCRSYCSRVSRLINTHKVRLGGFILSVLMKLKMFFC